MFSADAPPSPPPSVLTLPIDALARQLPARDDDHRRARRARVRHGVSVRCSWQLAEYAEDSSDWPESPDFLVVCVRLATPCLLVITFCVINSISRRLAHFNLAVTIAIAAGVIFL